MINTFPGYEFVLGKDNKMHNMYRGTDVGFGGYVYSEPGIYYDVALCDVGNMHGASIINLNKFGEDTKNYADIRNARMAIKNRNFEEARRMLNGALAPYLDEKDPDFEDKAESLQAALKLILNSTYGIAAATFDNPLRDPRDKNNIIALRGALFMRTLQDEVNDRGFRVKHIKTDSLKVPHASKEIINFIMEFGEKYGYEFEHEATYERMCLVNDAVYIAKYADSDYCMDKYGYIPKDNKKHPNEWVAVGAQFQVPYVFKTLFSKEAITFEDLCETKSVKTSLYLDMNEGYPDVTPQENAKKKLEKRVKDGKATEEEVAGQIEELNKEIEKGHNYIFVGRVGQFTPVKEGCGGGVLVRSKDDKYDSVSGTKKDRALKDGESPVYRWHESEVLRVNHQEDDVDMSYFNDLANDAIATIEKFGNFNDFVYGPVDAIMNDKEEPDFMKIPETDQEEVPFEAMNPPN